MEMEVTVFNAFFYQNLKSSNPQESSIKADLEVPHQFMPSLQDPAKKKRLFKIWRRVFLSSYFIGVMQAFQNRVKKYGAIRKEDHLEGKKKEIEENTIKVNRKPYVFYSDGYFRSVWNIALVVILCLAGVITPFRVCMVDPQYDSEWLFVDATFDALFWFDLITNFFTAIEENGVVIDDLAQIAACYIKGWFFIDLMAVAPVGYFLQDDNNPSKNHSSSWNKLLRLVRLPRLYRLLRLLKLKKQTLNIKNTTSFARLLNKFNINEGLIKGMQLLVNILFVNHLVACAWFFVARIDNFDEQTWVFRHNMLDSSIYTKYLASFEWSLQTLTTVGYGDIDPVSINERILAIIWMIFGTGFFSYTLGKLSSILESVDKKWAEFERRMNLFNEFAMKVNLPPHIKNKVHKFYQNNYLKNVYTYMDPKEMIKELPSQLRNELILVCYYNLQQSISILTIDNNFTATLIPYLQFLEVQPGEVIYRQDDPPKDIFFIEKGKVNFVTKDNFTLITLLEASFFGEIEAFEAKNREYFTVAKEPTNLYFCSSTVFIELLKEFPTVAEEVLEIVKKRKRKYKFCLQMIESQREKNKGKDKEVDTTTFLKDSSQHYLSLIEQYEEEKKNKLNQKIQVKTVKRQSQKSAKLEEFVKQQEELKKIKD